MYHQEASFFKAADGIIAHNPVMKSVLVDKRIVEGKIVSLGIFDYWFQISKRRLV